MLATCLEMPALPTLLSSARAWSQPLGSPCSSLKGSTPTCRNCYLHSLIYFFIFFTHWYWKFILKLTCYPKPPQSQYKYWRNLAPKWYFLCSIQTFNIWGVFNASPLEGPASESLFLQTAKGRAVLQQVKDFMQQHVLPAQEVGAHSRQSLHNRSACSD